MKKRFIGIILIFLSFGIIVGAFVYTVVFNNQIVKPSKENIVNNSDTHITVTTKDDSLQVNKDGNVVDSTGKEVGDSTDNSNNTINSTKNNSSTQQNKSNSSDSNATSIDTININLKNSIQAKYGIDVLYGNDTVGYKIGGLTTVPITDSNVVNSELNLLNNLLALYPNNFFIELDNSIPLTIILLNNYSNTSVCGLTDSSYSKAVMSIAVGNEFVDTFHHEIYHYMERYIYKNDGSFSNWVNYNPVGFTYGDVNDSFPVYNRTLSSDVYFVNAYSKTDQYEDRASIFEYLMASSKASCLNKNMPVYKKAIVMSDLIDRYINSCSARTTEYWERFLVG